MNHKTFIAFKKNASLPISEIPPSFKTFASSSKKSFVVILHRVAVDRKTLKYRNKKFQSTNRQRCSSDYWLLRLLRLPKTANDCQRLSKTAKGCPNGRWLSWRPEAAGLETILLQSLASTWTRLNGNTTNSIHFWREDNSSKRQVVEVTLGRKTLCLKDDLRKRLNVNKTIALKCLS